MLYVARIKLLFVCMQYPWQILLSVAATVFFGLAVYRLHHNVDGVIVRTDSGRFLRFLLKTSISLPTLPMDNFIYSAPSMATEEDTPWRILIRRNCRYPVHAVGRGLKDIILNSRNLREFLREVAANECVIITEDSRKLTQEEFSEYKGVSYHIEIEEELIYVLTFNGAWCVGQCEIKVKNLSALINIE